MNSTSTGIIELLRTNDTVWLSWLVALLADSEIEAVIFDTHTSFAEGSISAIPQRLMVAASDETLARRIIKEADIQ